jgi:hypothetical protein
MIHCHIYEHSDYGVAAMTEIIGTPAKTGQKALDPPVFKNIGSCPTVSLHSL